jgi:hypothetical protein
VLPAPTSVPSMEEAANVAEAPSLDPAPVTV